MGLSGGLATNGTSGGGSGGVSSAAVAWAQREQARLAALGLNGQNFDIFGAPALTTSALASGTVYGHLVGMVAGDVVTNIWVLINTVGAGTAPTGIFFGLYTTGGTLLASSANTASDAKWTTTATFVSFALSSPFTVPSSGGYYLAILENGAFGTTPMKLEQGTGSALGGEHSPSGTTVNVDQTAQTVLPSPTATWVPTIASPFWIGWS